MTWDLDFRYQDGRVQRSLYHHLSKTHHQYSCLLRLFTCSHLSEIIHTVVWMCVQYVYNYQLCKRYYHLCSYLVGSPPFKLREPLEEGGDPRADACNLPLYDTTCLAACTKFCRAFCSHVWIDPHKEPFNGKKAALISKLKHTLQQSPICFCNCSQAITYISFLNGVKYLPLYHLQCDGR